MLYVPLHFGNGFTIDAVVDSRAYVSAIAQTELDGIKQQVSAYIFKIDDPPIFQIQVANGQLENPYQQTSFNLTLEITILQSILS